MNAPCKKDTLDTEIRCTECGHVNCDHDAPKMNAPRKKEAKCSTCKGKYPDVCSNAAHYNPKQSVVERAIETGVEDDAERSPFMSISLHEERMAELLALLDRAKEICHWEHDRKSRKTFCEEWLTDFEKVKGAG